MKKKSWPLCLCIGLLLAACSPKTEESPVEEKFHVMNPIQMDTVYTKEYVADIHSLQNVELRARIRGYVEAIHVDEGKSVKAGQLLFSISNKEYKEALIKAKASLKSAIADAKASELDVKNVQTLVDKNVVSKTELELAISKLDAANAKIEEAKSDEASALLNISLTEIKAPFDGIINRIPNKVGSLIDEGMLLTSLSNNLEVFAYFNVSEKEYLDFITKPAQEKKQEVELILANSQPHKQKGFIETVDGEFDKTSGNIAFRARFSNPDGILKHGSSGKVRIKTELKNAVLIPQKTTFEIQEKIYVFVVDQKNEVVMKSIVTQLRIGKLYVITSGLNPSDKIIYEGIQRVKAGEKVIADLVSSKQILEQTKN